MSQFIELEIQNILNETSDLDEASIKLIQLLEATPEQFNTDNISALARFLVSAGKFKTLIEFILRHLSEENFPIPWAYLLEALALSQTELDAKMIHSLLDGIYETHGEFEAARSKALDDYDTSFSQWREQRKIQNRKKYLEGKKELLDELLMLRTQQLYQQEKALLLQLQKLYPQDAEIALEVSNHKQQYALEVLNRRSPKTSIHPLVSKSDLDPEVELALKALTSSLLDHSKQDPEMAIDFAVVAFMLEAYETALEILTYCTPSVSCAWFRLEVLLQCRHFVDLLTEISEVELRFAHDPETFFATAYLRAQALWGLGQKHAAIEVMEGLLTSRPHYRSGNTLLRSWSGQ